MWRSFAPRRLLLSSWHSSSSSIAPCPWLVRSSLLSSFSYYSSRAPPLSRRQDEESRNVKVSVWWDYDSCGLPTGFSVIDVAPTLREVLEANGINGPIKFNAFGDIFQLSRVKREAFHKDYNFNHIPNGGNNSVKRSLFFNLMYWVSKNPPPVHLFFISGDRDLANVLHLLRVKSYNILLATIDSPRDVLCSAASIMWCWNSLISREKVVGTHFNYPPHPSYGSYYDYGRVISWNTEEFTPDSKVHS